MVTVRVSETYDLSTKVDKMGIVAVHTPTGTLADRLWGGLALHYKKFRFVKCDIAMACASMLPADPLQIGVTAGDIAPQDMFNPILYKAVSNDSMNRFLAWANLVDEASGLTGAFSKNSIVDINNPTFKSAADAGNIDLDQFGMYYSLLSDTDGWRKAMPQAGLTMRGLVPLVYQVLSQYGAAPNTGSADFDTNFPVPSLDAESVDSDPISTDGLMSSLNPRSMRGPAMRMPSVETTCYSTGTGADPNTYPIFGNLGVASCMGNVPPAYVGLIILPPAKLNQLYYRLKVTWTIEFTGLRSLNEVSNWTGLYFTGLLSYGTDYDVQSKTMASKTDMVDTNSAEITKIMEGAA